VAQIPDPFFQILTDGVHRFEGTVQYTRPRVSAERHRVKSRGVRSLLEQAPRIVAQQEARPERGTAQERHVTARAMRARGEGRRLSRLPEPQSLLPRGVEVTARIRQVPLAARLLKRLSSFRDGFRPAPCGTWFRIPRR
jgi:hypothetical protein